MWAYSIGEVKLLTYSTYLGWYLGVITKNPNPWWVVLSLWTSCLTLAKLFNHSAGQLLLSANGTDYLPTLTGLLWVNWMRTLYGKAKNARNMKCFYSQETLRWIDHLWNSETWLLFHSQEDQGIFKRLFHYSSYLRFRKGAVLMTPVFILMFHKIECD